MRLFGGTNRDSFLCFARGEEARTPTQATAPPFGITLAGLSDTPIDCCALATYLRENPEVRPTFSARVRTRTGRIKSVLPTWTAPFNRLSVSAIRLTLPSWIRSGAVRAFFSERRGGVHDAKPPYRYSRSAPIGMSPTRASITWLRAIPYHPVCANKERDHSPGGAATPPKTGGEFGLTFRLLNIVDEA